MKNSKYILHSVAVLAVAALATACSSEEELTDKTSGSKETVTITAYQPGSETRVGFDKYGNGYWQAGDGIGVWSVNAFSPLSLSSGAGEATASFTGETTNPKGQYAVYPYNENHKLSSSSLTYYLPSSYTYTSVAQTVLTDKDGNSFCAPMWGKVSDSDNTVSFKHLGGVLCIKVDKMPAESGTVKVTEAKNQLCGTFTANLADSNPEMKTAKATANNSVTFKYSGATADAAGVFYLPVATGDYSFTIIVSGGTKHSATTSTVTINRAKLQVVNVQTSYSEDGSVTINGHKFIDLGLPSGLLWAETNIGAETAYDDGNYYAWGETETNTKNNYILGTYNYNSLGLTKYTSSDNKTVLEDSDDAACQNWGSSCRMPTQTDFTELCNTDNCTWTWTSKTNSSNEEINGYEVTSKVNGNSIFFPASGFRYQVELCYRGSGGYYWSSKLYYSNVSYAYILNFSSGGAFSSHADEYRYYGLSVRPVAEP